MAEQQAATTQDVRSSPPSRAGSRLSECSARAECPSPRTHRAARNDGRVPSRTRSRSGVRRITKLRRGGLRGWSRSPSRASYEEPGLPVTPETLPHHQGALIIADAFKRFKVEQEYGMGVIQGRFGVPSNYTMYQEEAHKMLHEILPDNTMDEDDRVMYYESGQQRWVLNGSGEMWQVFRTNLGRRPAVTGDWQYGDKIMVRDADAQPFFRHAWLLPKGKLPRVPPGMKWEQRRMIDEAAGSAITDDVPETGRTQSFWILVHDVAFFDPERERAMTIWKESLSTLASYERERAMTISKELGENSDWEERGDDWQQLGTASSSQPGDHDGRADDHGRWRRRFQQRDAPYPPSRRWQERREALARKGPQ